ncbi:MAG TPA: hypothetical protein VFR64_13000 [Methylomirabilota bacterium]|nr:hypothetical protein [Methylomirabilota bacterium]
MRSRSRCADPVAVGPAHAAATAPNSDIRKARLVASLARQQHGAGSVMASRGYHVDDILAALPD